MSNVFYRWFLVAMLSCAFFFHQADRALFGLLTIPIQRDLGLSDVQIGWINSVLSWTLAGMAFIAGPAGDRFSRKWIITVSLMAWSLMTFMMGFVGDWRVCGVVVPAFFVVMFFRSVATGIGESFYGPCYPPLIAAYHKRTRSIALSIHQGSLYFGLMTCGAITAWALDFLESWRHVFMLFGAAGFLLGLLFIFALRDGGGEPAACARKELPDGKESPLAGVRYFFRTPTAVCAMAGFAAIVFANNAYLFWAPKYMATKFGTSVPEAGTQTMLWHHLFAFAAILAGGVLTDRFVGKMPRFRIGFQSVAMLCGAPCLAAIALMPSAFSMIAMTAAYGVFRGFFEVNTHATLFDVIPARYRSTAVGIFTVFAFLFGGLSGVAMGALSQKYAVHGFEKGFMLMSAAYVVGALFVMYGFFFSFRKDRFAYDVIRGRCV